MTCNSRKIKEVAERYYDSADYEAARQEEFARQLKAFLDEKAVDEGDLQNFLDEFEFPDEWGWAENEALNDCIDAAERRHDMLKDEK